MRYCLKSYLTAYLTAFSNYFLTAFIFLTYLGKGTSVPYQRVYASY